MNTQSQEGTEFRAKLSPKANKVLEGYRYIYGLESKQDACNRILETYPLKQELEDYLKDLDQEE